ncbi:phospholipase A-2-activating protein-like [Zophobas morio]|uniref:phospholipase A-2-activating protein-like n=1 Tax=Zophobas morio TaxID=2755281 RepID=UPI0030837867
MTYNAHQHYVSTCYFCPPNDTYQKGLIISGSNDKVVYVFELGKVEPLYTLCGHTDAICCIACGNYAKKLFIATASWDTTIKVWENGLCRATLSSHTAAVWCCCFVDSTCLWSGSADKTIKVWALTRNSQKLVATLEGHTDAVRGLVFLPATSTRHVASCSNDASIMIWSTQTYECLKVLRGHNNYIYSICRLNAGSGFVTCGEDKTLKFSEF